MTQPQRCAKCWERKDQHRFGGLSEFCEFEPEPLAARKITDPCSLNPEPGTECPECGFKHYPLAEDGPYKWWVWKNPLGKFFVIKEGVEESWAVLDEPHGIALADRFNSRDGEVEALVKALEKIDTTKVRYLGWERMVQIARDALKGHREGKG